jgi:hypothetical protein
LPGVSAHAAEPGRSLVIHAGRAGALRSVTAGVRAPSGEAAKRWYAR